MKKIILVIMLFFVIGCVKVEEGNCKDAREGIIVVLEKPFLSYTNAKVNALFFLTSTIDDIRNDSTESRTGCLAVVNKLPKEYAKGDTVAVCVSYRNKPEVQFAYGIPTIEITCIERIND